MEYKTGKKGRVLHTQRMWAIASKGCWHEVRTTEDIHILIADWSSGDCKTCS